MTIIYHENLKNKIWDLVYTSCAIKRNPCHGDKDDKAITLEQAKEIAKDIIEMLECGWKAEDVVRCRGK